MVLDITYMRMKQCDQALYASVISRNRRIVLLTKQVRKIMNRELDLGDEPAYSGSSRCGHRPRSSSDNLVASQTMPDSNRLPLHRVL